MKFSAFKLGTPVCDKASGRSGELTHLIMDCDKTIRYWFQPQGLNSETGKPLGVIYLTPDRVINGVAVSIDLPSQLLGTLVHDRASGFAGIAIAIVQHINGCVHFDVQPQGKSTKDGSPVGAENFDIRRLAGDAIPKLADEEIEASRKKNPSPQAVPIYQPNRP